MIPFIALSTLILGSIQVSAGSLSQNAAGYPGILARATAIFGVIWITVTAGLLPVLGIAAIGVGNLLGALVEAWLLNAAVHRTANVRVYRPLIRPLVVALSAGTAGFVACTAAPPGLAVSIGSALLTFALCVGGLFLLCADDTRDTFRVGMRGVRVAITRAH